MNLDFYATPSFCNSWPLISVEVNGQELWCGYVDSPQIIAVEFKPQEHNQVLIRYLNKNQGPVLWDTVVDAEGKILQDQFCIIKDIRVAKSRCDFIIHNLIYHGDDGTSTDNLHGFMSKRGHYCFEFPQDVYGWILDKRREKIFHQPDRISSLDYWTNYIGDNSHAEMNKLLLEIKQILNKL
jgi:hypothetical protein